MLFIPIEQKRYSQVLYKYGLSISLINTIEMFTESLILNNSFNIKPKKIKMFGQKISKLNQKDLSEKLKRKEIVTELKYINEFRKILTHGVPGINQKTKKVIIRFNNKVKDLDYICTNVIYKCRKISDCLLSEENVSIFITNKRKGYGREKTAKN